VTRFKVLWLVAFALGGLGLWAAVSMKRVELGAKAAARPWCLDAGVPSEECDRRIDQNSAKCFLFTSPSVAGRGQPAPPFDEAGYRDCVTSPSAQVWVDERGRRRRAALKEENDRRRQTLAPPP
jgi:hypothetical protein